MCDDARNYVLILTMKLSRLSSVSQYQYTYVSICVCARARVCVCTRAYLHACECVHMCVSMYVHVCVCAYVCTCISMHTCIYIHKCNKNLTPLILAQCCHTQESNLRTSKSDFFRSVLLCDFPMSFVHYDPWWDNFCLGTKVVPP